MERRIIIGTSRSKTLGFSQIIEGILRIEKMACYEETIPDFCGPFSYEVLGVFFDDDEIVLGLNGLHKEISVLNDDDTSDVHIVKAATGSFFDKLLPAIKGMSFDKCCAYFNNPENGFVGKYIAVTWRNERSPSDNYPYVTDLYLPSADLFDTKEAAEVAMKATE